MKKVLVADDTKNIRNLLMKCLQMEGYEVKTANDGNAAKEILLKEDFDLAFIDIKMPFLSGTDVIRSIREMGITIPVIVITAYATVKNAIDCTQMGAVAYLQKPFTADKIKAVLKEYFDETLKDSESIQYSITAARDLIDKGEFSQALQLLQIILPKDIANPEIYLLLSRIYCGLGNSDMEKKFYQTSGIFSKL
jgi:two-component system, OmpR family, response regulator